MSEGEEVYIIQKKPKKQPNVQSGQFGTFTKEIISPYAKELRAKNPSLKQSDAVKQAWEVYRADFQRFKANGVLPKKKKALSRPVPPPASSSKVYEGKVLPKEKKEKKPSKAKQMKQEVEEVEEVEEVDEEPQMNIPPVPSKGKPKNAPRKKAAPRERKPRVMALEERKTAPKRQPRKPKKLAE